MSLLNSATSPASPAARTQALKAAVTPPLRSSATTSASGHSRASQSTVSSPEASSTTMTTRKSRKVWAATEGSMVSSRCRPL
jgi:hypothetical protein